MRFLSNEAIITGRLRKANSYCGVDLPEYGQDISQFTVITNMFYKTFSLALLKIPSFA